MNISQAGPCDCRIQDALKQELQESFHAGC